jgi:hypothetical protein
VNEVFLLSRRVDDEGSTVEGVFTTSWKARAFAERREPTLIGKWTGDYPFGWSARMQGIQNDISYVVDVATLDPEK